LVLSGKIGHKAPSKKYRVNQNTHLNISLIGGTNPPGRINTERSLRLVRRYRAGRRHLIAARQVTGKAAYIAHYALTGEAYHEGGAVVAFGRGGEGASDELMVFTGAIVTKHVVHLILQNEERIGNLHSYLVH
jgi:hypothetical protein